MPRIFAVFSLPPPRIGVVGDWFVEEVPPTSITELFRILYHTLHDLTPVERKTLSELDVLGSQMLLNVLNTSDVNILDVSVSVIAMQDYQVELLRKAQCLKVAGIIR